MRSPLIRIFSDLHFGAPSSSLTHPAQLAPLLDGATAIILNGDTLDTRPSPADAQISALRAEIDQFFRASALPTTFLTGNHDPDLSPLHHAELAEGRVCVTHGDILFEDLVPWSHDANLARQLVAAELEKLSPTERQTLTPRLSAYRRAAAAIPYRHHLNPRGLGHLLAFARDTVWPPVRIFRILRAWREVPARAEQFVRTFTPHARFLVMGHTHRPGAIRTASGIVVLNTGSFCPPGGCGVVDLTTDRIRLRHVARRAGEFRLADTLAEFSLARP